MTPQSDGLSLSIAMCTYNGEAFLPPQLESIAAQTKAPVEMIVCDDQSQDRTLEILSDFAQEVAFPVRIFRNERNLGSTKNFEKAINACTGDIIVLSDQDDVWHEDKLRRIFECFDVDQDIGMVFSDAEIVNEALEPVGYGLWEAVNFTRAEQAALQSHAHQVLLKHNVVTGATMAFRENLREIFLPIPSSWIHDGWIAMMLATTASAIRPLPEQLIKYRQHPNSQIGAKKLTILDRVRYHGHVLRATRHARAESFLLTAQAFSLVLQAAERLPAAELHAEAVREIRRKVAHLRLRAEIATISRPKRLSRIRQEVMQANYFRYSYGIWSIFRDLLTK